MEWDGDREGLEGVVCGMVWYGVVWYGMVCGVVQAIPPPPFLPSVVLHHVSCVPPHPSLVPALPPVSFLSVLDYHVIKLVGDKPKRRFAQITEPDSSRHLTDGLETILFNCPNLTGSEQHLPTLSADRKLTGIERSPRTLYYFCY